MRSSDAQFSYNVVKVISCLSFLTRLLFSWNSPRGTESTIKRHLQP